MQDEDDPVLLKEDRDTMEIRMLYLMCREEYLSALSFGPVRSGQTWPVPARVLT